MSICVRIHGTRWATFSAGGPWLFCLGLFQQLDVSQLQPDVVAFGAAMRLRSEARPGEADDPQKRPLKRMSSMGVFSAVNLCFLF